MNLKVKLDNNAICPTRAHKTDAGLDLYMPKNTTIWGCDVTVIDTGVHIEIPDGYVGYIKARSSYLKRGITVDGTIDSGYRGSIGVMLHNHVSHRFVLERGEKIAQLVIQPIELPDIVIVDELEDTERGNGGFGSTGR